MKFETAETSSKKCGAEAPVPAWSVPAILLQQHQSQWHSPSVIRKSMHIIRGALVVICWLFIVQSLETSLFMPKSKIMYFRGGTSLGHLLFCPP